MEFIKLVAKKIKCSASLAFYLFSPSCLINSIKHEHSCKILYVFSRARSLNLDLSLHLHLYDMFISSEGSGVRVA